MEKNDNTIGRRALLTGAAAGVGGLVVGVPSGAAATVKPKAETACVPSGAATVVPSSRQYPDLVKALNARYTAAPASVHVVDAPAQVEPLVADAAARKARLTVRSGGHCLEDFVYSSDVQMIIDMSNMNRIYYDPTYNAIAVEAGAILMDVYDKLYQTWGVTVPGGICYSVGMGGHVAGAGWGLLVRRNGLIVDHLYAVEVVTVDASGNAKTIVATRETTDPYRDLWWAHTGGGGGNFGVVTRYFFRSPNATGTDPAALLPSPPAYVLYSVNVWPWPQLTKDTFVQLIQNYANWHVTNSAATSPTRFLNSFLILNHASNGAIVMITQVDSAAPNASGMLTDYVTAMGQGVGAPIPAAMNKLPWLQATRLIGTTNALLNDPTQRGEYKSAYMKAAFTPAQAEALYKHLSRTDISNPNMNVQLSPYGGAVRAVAPTATAMAHRGAAFKMLWAANWTNPADDATYIAWARDCYQDTFAATGGVPVLNDVTDGCYINYPDADLSDPTFNRSTTKWSTLYYKENYPRLQQVKLKYDPTNFFRHRQSVQLPS
ncbi:FAD-linked oxidase [Actinoplanes capillaceus]|uniref:FAD-linked oxidase n=1 Tax=Actinoplanes campanulatus TaxID=113559 RepID=A0ABQ3WSM2_9ACTN|nr:FAD-binding oxidoreductase [Actinoplanes capillaceus]GID49235.1 FAD-linked oxidase [Actinoplanes capillaceus]